MGRGGRRGGKFERIGGDVVEIGGGKGGGWEKRV